VRGEFPFISEFGFDFERMQILPSTANSFLAERDAREVGLGAQTAMNYAESYKQEAGEIMRFKRTNRRQCL